MKKYNVMGYEMVKVRDLRHTVRKLRRTVKERYNMFDAEKQAMIHLAYNDIVKQLYLEEFNRAKTPDEIRAVLEMPGDFVVYRGGKDRYDITYFAGWDENGEAKPAKPLRPCGSSDPQSFCLHMGIYLTTTEVAWRLGPSYQYRKPSRSITSPTFRFSTAL